jgi:hypothetical protein
MNKNGFDGKGVNTREIVIKNFLLDIRNVIRANFVESYKGYAILAIGFMYFCKKNIPSFKYFPNNSSVPLGYINKNKTIQVRTTQRTVRNYNQPDIDEYTDQNKIILNLKHKPYIKPLRRGLQTSSDKQLVLDNNELVVHLTCIEYISKEGVYALKKLIEKKKLYLKFNHIRYHDTPELYGWLLYRSWLTNVNINELLIKSGYAKLGSIKDTDIYDEHIYYYHADLVEAEEEAKAEGRGIWRNMRNSLNEQHSSFSKSIRFMTKYFNMKRWEKAVFRK